MKEGKLQQAGEIWDRNSAQFSHSHLRPCYLFTFLGIASCFLLKVRCIKGVWKIMHYLSESRYCWSNPMCEMSLSYSPWGPKAWLGRHMIQWFGWHPVGRPPGVPLQPILNSTGSTVGHKCNKLNENKLSCFEISYWNQRDMLLSKLADILQERSIGVPINGSCELKIPIYWRGCLMHLCMICCSSSN